MAGLDFEGRDVRREKRGESVVPPSLVKNSFSLEPSPFCGGCLHRRPTTADLLQSPAHVPARARAPAQRKIRSSGLNHRKSTYPSGGVSFQRVPMKGTVYSEVAWV